MRVTKVDPLIARLVTFLNFDFKSGTEENLKKARLNIHELRRPDWQSRGEKLQEEIRLDLIPLLLKEPTDEANERETKRKLWQQWQKKRWRNEKVKRITANLMAAEPRLYHGPGFYLDRLLEKISSLNLQYRWYAEPGQHELTVYDPDLTKPLSKKTGFPEPIPGTERKISNPARKLLGTERRKTTIVGEKFIVAKQLSNTRSFRELLYGIIAESLENGEFSRLRMCPQCRNFFVVHDPKRKFCEDKCKEEFLNRERANKGYFKENRKKRRLLLLTKARRLLCDGESVTTVTEETGLSRRILDREGLLD